MEFIIHDISIEKAITARAGDVVNPSGAFDLSLFRRRYTGFINIVYILNLYTDIISKQVRLSNFCYPKNRKAAFDLPVVYEDDHIAIGMFFSPSNSRIRHKLM